MRTASRSSRLLQATLCGAAAIVSCGSARADVVVSTAATSNMACSGGVCAPTATDAVLNVGDLETLLASGNVTVTTAGSGVQATNIEIVAPLSWSTANTLSLDAYESISVSKPVSVAGLGGLSITTNDGGSNGFFSFGQKGNVTFANLSSPLTINGAAFTLENNIKSLASAIAANPSGNYALANNYDAKIDGIYTSSPVTTTFTGTVEGLGNTVSHLGIRDQNPNDDVGLFAQIGVDGTVADLKLAKVSLKVTGIGNPTGGLAGWNYGVVQGVTVSGVIKLKNTVGAGLVGNNDGTISRSTVVMSIDSFRTIAGGLVGLNAGTISLSSATGSIDSSTRNKHECCATAGGLVGGSIGGSIDQCFAAVSIVAHDQLYAGGLVASSSGSVTRSYATGGISDLEGINSVIGTFSGEDGSGSTISQTYGAGLLKVGKEGTKGGFVGIDNSQPGSIASSYWDTTTSGFGNLKHGAGNLKNDPGIAGLTSAQLQSGLPTGFDPTIWAEDPNINDGFPYLIANPPSK